MACLPARASHRVPIALTQKEMNVYQWVSGWPRAAGYVTPLDTHRAPIALTQEEINV